ncbi:MULTISPECIES: 23S rRNA pseudouridine(2604) synthase RluF [Pasteurellaceae]|uniref:23S rRNA pseudouridine(2604) synthase RluF n=3 Tax=Pasteurellaceae TaxID=712 RepID=A0ACC6HL75_9PAST|nr:23S rRNA pseudouridine(2604) synthase RluF [Pasteurella atlantica]MBR0573927.1 23S rRNA pseudouridine(2604) synthase RluF [Pasteurella atlantica]MDP8039838.1 23S rRNA pseudouridine(2604) synthase RluF [Pasteurella atlantica]MDP8042002.1 23S rRNA pseudouridine(2604) synthase RluF [Pasteurella atlantica]MDP8044151.1 23S rRNA pseudouridine(2604) synthase RluF [Pasteurella atlantica]MDP8046201.1 23S rRNA pseudouridine(2604) synthase RluF [Pasteurella atlantica]
MEQNRESINLNKYISSTGICSRREAEKFIEQGRVTINGKKTQLGNRVFEGDVVKIDGKPLRAKPKTIYIAVNKPVGIVCTTDSKEQKNIVNFVGHPQRLFPIGRLDKPSEGLIFLTNDGDIVNKILRAGNNHEKEYIVTVDKPINDRFIQRMANGIPILGTVTKKCKVEKISDRVFKIILIQGLNRQIRRMCEYLGYEVQRLKRVRIMNVSLDRLKTGEWRELTSKEMAEINKLVATSKKTSDVIDKVSHQKVSQKKSPHKNAPSKNKTFRKDQPSEKRFKPKFGHTKR